MNYNLGNMLIMIYGEDIFRVQEKVQQIKQAFLEKFDSTGMNLAVFPSNDEKKLNVADVLQAVCSYPFLGTKRMVIIQGLFDQIRKPDESVWLEGFSRMPESTITVLYEIAGSVALEKKKFFHELVKFADVHKYVFPKLEGSYLSKWVSERIIAKGGTIESFALQDLIIRVGSDLWQMSQEIDKLVGFAKNEIISREMVQMLVHASFESKIFELMDAFSKRQRNRALKLLEEERESGSDDHYLLTMLGRQVRILISVRSFLNLYPQAGQKEIADSVGVHPFVAQKAIGQARLFSMDELTRAHQLLFEFDRNMKTGKINAGLATDLVAESFLG